MHHVWCSFILLKSKNSTMSDVSDVKKVDTTKIPFQVSSQVGLQHFSFSCQNPPPVLPLPCYHPAHWHQCHHSFHNHHPSQKYLFNHEIGLKYISCIISSRIVKSGYWMANVTYDSNPASLQFWLQLSAIRWITLGLWPVFSSAVTFHWGKIGFWSVAHFSGLHLCMECTQYQSHQIISN